MNSPEMEAAFDGRAASRGQRWVRDRVHALLSSLRGGELTMREGGERRVFGSREHDAPRVVVDVHDPAFWTRLAFDGGIGAAESYAEGLWTCDDLTTLLRLVVASDEVNLGLERGAARWKHAMRTLARRVLSNTVERARGHISRHYDLSNALFESFLDPTMTYSSAIFTSPEQSLEAAQEAKIERLCRKLDLGPGDHLLEVGTGWGHFALHAARTFGCRVTTTTISKEQHHFAVERIRAAGLADRVVVLFEDFRRLRGTFSKLVSVEMIEAVGDENVDRFFECCSKLLQPDGRMAIQAITIADRHFERARREIDFIKKHIFPGSCLPSMARMSDAIARVTDMTIAHVEDIGHHYAETLRRWRRRFLENRELILGLGFDQTFIRLWEYYFSYCEAGFEERQIGDVHLVAMKPKAKGVVAW